MNKVILGIAMGLTLSACVPNESYIDDKTGRIVSGNDRTALRGDLSQRLEALVDPMYYAKEIAKNCSRYSYNVGLENNRIRDLVRDLRRANYRESDIDAAIRGLKDTDGTKQKEWQAFVNRYDIIYAQPETYCRAGDGETIKGSAIAQYLRKKG